MVPELGRAQVHLRSSLAVTALPRLPNWIFGEGKDGGIRSSELLYPPLIIIV